LNCGKSAGSFIVSVTSLEGICANSPLQSRCGRCRYRAAGGAGGAAGAAGLLDETVLEVLWLTTELVEVEDCDELLVRVEELESCEEVEDIKAEVVLLDSDDEVDFVELISVLLLETTGASL
jgi:hypothetical protein